MHKISSFAKDCIVLFVLSAAMLGLAFGQQVADPNFQPKVTRATFTKNHPKVLFDEAHLIDRCSELFPGAAVHRCPNKDAEDQ